MLRACLSRNAKVSASGDHNKNCVKVGQVLVRHLLCNCLIKNLVVAIGCNRAHKREGKSDSSGVEWVNKLQVNKLQSQPMQLFYIW